jgi:hypothetical protein
MAIKLFAGSFITTEKKLSELVFKWFVGRIIMSVINLTQAIH